MLTALARLSSRRPLPDVSTLMPVCAVSPRLLTPGHHVITPADSSLCVTLEGSTALSSPSIRRFGTHATRYNRSNPSTKADRVDPKTAAGGPKEPADKIVFSLDDVFAEEGAETRGRDDEETDDDSEVIHGVRISSSVSREIREGNHF